MTHAPTQLSVVILFSAPSIFRCITRLSIDSFRCRRYSEAPSVLALHPKLQFQKHTLRVSAACDDARMLNVAIQTARLGSSVQLGGIQLSI